MFRKSSLLSYEMYKRVSFSHLDLCVIDKTSSGVARDATKCDINKTLIGKVCCILKDRLSLFFNWYIQILYCSPVFSSSFTAGEKNWREDSSALAQVFSPTILSEFKRFIKRINLFLFPLKLSENLWVSEEFRSIEVN